MADMTRDPRTDPRPGDVVKVETIGVALVTSYDSNQVVWFVTQHGRAGWMPRKDWRKFCKCAEVIHTAEGGV
jgi:hypothetical protein